jgi:hypothetical protein
MINKAIFLLEEVELSVYCQENFHYHATLNFGKENSNCEVTFFFGK